MKTQMRHKHYVLDQNKIRQAKKILNAKTEKETIEKALDVVLYEVGTKQSCKDKGSIEDIFDIATNCQDSDMACKIRLSIPFLSISAKPKMKMFVSRTTLVTFLSATRWLPLIYIFVNKT